MIPAVLHRLADALAALRGAAEAVGDGFVTDYIHEAELDVFRALRLIADSQVVMDSKFEEILPADAERLVQEFDERLADQQRRANATLADVAALIARTGGDHG